MRVFCGCHLYMVCDVIKLICVVFQLQINLESQLHSFVSPEFHDKIKLKSAGRCDSLLCGTLQSHTSLCPCFEYELLRGPSFPLQHPSSSPCVSVLLDWSTAIPNNHQCLAVPPKRMMRYLQLPSTPSFLSSISNRTPLNLECSLKPYFISSPMFLPFQYISIFQYTTKSIL